MTVTDRRRTLILRAAASFCFDPLERRTLMCTVDGEHFIELHEAGAIEAAEAEPNNTAATATPFGTSDTFSGSISPVSDIDYFGGNLNHGDRLRVRVGTDPGQRHYKPLVEILDAGEKVLMTSDDGHEMNFYAPVAGAYYVRLSGAHAYGAFSGSYGTDGGSNLISVTVSAFSGSTESEPNDSLATADAMSATQMFRGTLATSDESDYFSFSTSAGSAIAMKFGGTSETNPTVRLYNPSNVLVATDTTGVGLHFVAPTTGTYRFQISGDNDAGAVSGTYVGSLVNGTSAQAVESEPANDTFDGAVTLNLSTSATRMTGTLDSMSDADLFSFNFQAGRWYSFTIDTSAENAARFGRQMTLFNEFGQQMESSYTGSLSTNAATGFGFRIERTGRHYLGIRAIDPTGLGGYIISGSQSQTFPTQRDVPLIFHDYTGQRTHLGYGPAAPLTTPATIPAMIGMFEARYDVYDVDVTTTLPQAGVTHVGFGAGDFGSIGAYGYGGSFNLGTRRATGDSVLDDSGSGFSSLNSIRGAASVMNQEVGHAAGLYAHARNALGFMAYDSQSAGNVIGTYFPFPWTDSRVPDVETRNEREQQDWIFQSGRIAEEVEPNPLGNPQHLNDFLDEMADATPRNDRVALAGRIDGVDSDIYSLFVSAGETFAIDIDAAEFQHPLDATVRVYSSAGTLISAAFDSLDRESGLRSVDPYLVQSFPAAGTYRIEVSGANGTFGNYRLKVTSGEAFDTAGPRVIASWPNGGASADGTRQLLFWMNDKLDPASLTSSNISVVGNVTGTSSGTATFDPTDGVLIWLADSQLPADTYTVIFNGKSGGVRDLRGNLIDGETDGTMQFPEISGDGIAGEDFRTTFTITGADNSPAAVSASTIRRHPYNRVLFTLTYNDDLNIQSVYTSNLRLRGTGPDNIYNTADDRLLPLDINYDKVKSTSGRQLELYSRGVPDFGNHRVEGSFLDAAGNTVNVATSLLFTSSQYTSGPSVADVSVQPGSAVTTPLSSITVTFSQAIDTDTLIGDTFMLRYSPDATFFDGDDSFISDADGIMSWDATNLRATFTAAGDLADGYYLIQLDGDAGGIAALNGQLLDGDWLDSNLAGGSLFSLWQDAPTGDGFAGGDYNAPFALFRDGVSPELQLHDFGVELNPPGVLLGFSENVGASLAAGDLVLTNLTTSQTIASSSLAVSFDPSTNIATISFPGLAGGVLPDGNYRLTITPGTVTDPAGNPLVAPAPVEFFVLAGDANRDRSVDIGDFSTLAVNFNQSPRTFSQGDFDYSDGVDVADFAILASRFNTSLPAAGDLPRVASALRAASVFASDRVGDERMVDDVLI